jgi:translation initiation factor IF-3
VTFKEVRLSPKIGSGDFLTKLHRAVEFLEDGDRIKVTVRFRGRELSHPELGRKLLERFAKLVEEHGVVERQPVLEGKSMFIVLASTHKPKVVEPASRPPRGEDGADAASGSPAEAAATPAAAAVTEAAPAPAPAPKAAPPAAAAEPTEKAETPESTATTEPTAAETAPATAKAEPKANGAETAQAATPTTGD